MEYLPYTVKWLEAILRWGHVLFAILWVGNSFLFNYLDNKLNKNITSKEIIEAVTDLKRTYERAMISIKNPGYIVFASL